MSRVQLALNVSDLDAAVDFYSKLFGSPPAKVRPGYANFAIADPPLKLVLIEHADARGSGVAGALNHLGVEVEEPDAGGAGQRAASPARASTRWTSRPRPVATPCRTRCGSRTPTPHRGRSTRCSPTLPVETGLAGDGTCCADAEPARRRRRRRRRRAAEHLSPAARRERDERRRAVAAAARGVPRQRVPRRRRHRLGHRRPAALARQHRASSCSRTRRRPRPGSSPSS